MCKTKNVIVEIIEEGEAKRTYVLREIPQVPNQPAQTLAVFDNAEDLAQFLDNLTV